MPHQSLLQSCHFLSSFVLCCFAYDQFFVFRLGVFHKEDQIISVNATYVKDLSLAGVVELLAKSGSRVKIEFLTVHALTEDGDGTVVSDRYVPLIRKFYTL